MQARSLFYANIDGQPFNTKEGGDFTEGNPFFKTEWMKAAAALPNGRLSTYFPARINLLKGQIHYLNEKGAEFIATSPMLELFLTDTTTGATYHFVKGEKTDRKNKDAWYQVLVVDSVTLYKVISKTLEEHTAYGTNVPKKKVLTIERYMVQQGNKAFVIKKPKELFALYPTQKEKLSAFIKSKPESDYPTIDAQFTALVIYLNSLLK
jgi:hypothetical protein